MLKSVYFTITAAARLPVSIFYVEETDYTESFYHSNEVLTLMLVLRLKVIF